jgi:hypothetical protein
METQETLKLDSLSTLQLQTETSFKQTIPVIEMLLSSSNNVDEIKDKKENSLGMNKSTKVNPSSKVASLFEIQNTLDDSLSNNNNNNINSNNMSENGNGVNGSHHKVVEVSNGDKSLNGSGNYANNTKMYIEDTESEGEDKQLNESSRKSLNCTNNKSNMNNTTSDFHLEMSKSFNDPSNLSTATKKSFIIPDTFAAEDCDVIEQSKETKTDATEEIKKQHSELPNDEPVEDIVNPTEKDALSSATDTIQLNTCDDIIPPTQLSVANVEETKIQENNVSQTDTIDLKETNDTQPIVETVENQLTKPEAETCMASVDTKLSTDLKSDSVDAVKEQETEPLVLNTPNEIERSVKSIEEETKIEEKTAFQSEDKHEEFKECVRDLAEVKLVTVGQQLSTRNSFKMAESKIDDKSIIINETIIEEKTAPPTVNILEEFKECEVSGLAEVKLVKPVDEQLSNRNSFKISEPKIDDESIIISDEEDIEVNSKSQINAFSQNSVIIPSTILDTSTNTETESIMSQVEVVDISKAATITKTPTAMRGRGRPSKAHILEESEDFQDEIPSAQVETDTASRSSGRST